MTLSNLYNSNVYKIYLILLRVTKNVDLNTEEGKKEMKKLTEEKKEPEKKSDTPVPSVL